MKPLNHALLVCAAFGLLRSSLPAQVEAFEGTLSEYFSLDEEGVSIGDAIFSDFTILPRQEGASGFLASFIDVIPLISDLSAPGFRFEVMDGATVDDFFNLRFSFRAHGVLFDSASLSLSTVNVRSDSNAGADVLLDLGDPAGSVDSLFAFAAPGNEGDLAVTENFDEIGDLGVEFDAVLDGGGAGRPGEVVAQLGAVDVRFGVSDSPVEVPIVIREFGVVDEATLFIEFTSTPSRGHLITGSEALVDGFSEAITLTAGDGQTDSSGLARVEFDVSALGDSHFFRVETSN